MFKPLKLIPSLFFIFYLLSFICFCRAETPQKFPPVSGTIFGQVSPGVRSATVNGKPVRFDADQNFTAAVRLRAGEKYLTLVINYDNLRIIKKYLILRKSAVSNFKVFVPKEKIEKSIAALKASRQLAAQQQAARRRARLKELAEEQRLAALAKAHRLKELAAAREKAWLDQTASPKFFANEFRASGEVGALLDEISAAGYGIPFKTREKSLAKLNELLGLPNFYDLVMKKNKFVPLTPLLRSLIAETEAYRYRPFTQLTPYQRKKLMLLNRLLIEALFASAPRRSTWLAAPPIPTFTKTKQYLFVWEFSEGKLLAVKQKQGSYSADIYIPVSKNWLNLKGLSEKDLQELIEKPVASFKEKKK
ncbi:MAG: hypothetical protein JW873_04805 [Candidatus Saganbacteria bacterium]|nr:hypothetical protein [Candidatus Saganbacteria bacterium]